MRTGRQVKDRLAGGIGVVVVVVAGSQRLCDKSLVVSESIVLWTHHTCPHHVQTIQHQLFNKFD